MTVKGGKHRLVDFVDLGEGHDLMSSLAGIPLFFFQKFVSVMYCSNQRIDNMLRFLSFQANMILNWPHMCYN